MKNILLVWKDPLARKYLLLRELVVLLSLFEYIGLPIGTFFIGREDYQTSGVFIGLTALSFYTSSKLGWYTQELLIRKATRKTS